MALSDIGEESSVFFVGSVFLVNSSDRVHLVMYLLRGVVFGFHRLVSDLNVVLVLLEVLLTGDLFDVVDVVLASDLLSEDCLCLCDLALAQIELIRVLMVLVHVALVVFATSLRGKRSVVCRW